MMNKIIWLLRTVWLFLPTVVSAVDKLDTIKIAGQIVADIQIDRVKVTYCDRYFGYSHFWTDAPMKEIAVVDGKFDFQLVTNHAYQYVMFEFGGEGKRLPLLRQLSDILFFTRADTDISLRIGDSCVFDGKGKALYDMQYRLKLLKPLFAPEYRSIDQTLHTAIAENPKESKRIYMDFLKATREINCKLLRKINGLIDIASGISDTERAVLKANERYGLANDWLRGLAFQSSLGRYAGKKNVREAIHDYFNAYPLIIGDNDNKDTVWPELSWAFADFTYFNALVGLTLSLQVEDPTARLKFPQLYEHIMATYRGDMRDKVLAVALLNFGSTKEIPNHYYKMASEEVSNKEEWRLIEKLTHERGVGVEGFPFRLPDTTGRYISFADLKGKVVVLDFWFTGCHGCLSLARAMRPVHEYFKNIPDVVFVNISIDTDKEQWVESVRSAKYGYPGSIALYTDGWGDKDEMIKHYNILAYPTLVIFDREGEIAHFNPRGPYSESERDEFIERIDLLL